MKNSAKYISLILAAGSAGVALFALANAPFTAAVRGDVLVAAAAALAIVGFAITDYSRSSSSLRTAARVLRPALPTHMTAHSAGFAPTSARSNRTAA